MTTLGETLNTILETKNKEKEIADKKAAEAKKLALEKRTEYLKTCVEPRNYPAEDVAIALKAAIVAGQTEYTLSVEELLATGYYMKGYYAKAAVYTAGVALNDEEEAVQKAVERAIYVDAITEAYAENQDLDASVNEDNTELTFDIAKHKELKEARVAEAERLIKEEAEKAKAAAEAEAVKAAEEKALTETKE